MCYIYPHAIHYCDFERLTYFSVAMAQWMSSCVNVDDSVGFCHKCGGRSVSDNIASSRMEGNMAYKETVMLYDSERVQKVLSGASLVDLPQLNLSLETVSCPDTERRGQDLPQSASLDRTSCLMCKAAFTTRDDQASHFKGDWHKFNLHQAVKGSGVVTEEEFQHIMEANDDVSSISGSDSGSSSDTDTDVMSSCHSRLRSRRQLLLRNSVGQLLSVQQCVLNAFQGKELCSNDELTRRIEQLPVNMCWAIIMLSGGHFAAAIFNGSSVHCHKTFHRYVVRAKRGTCQSSRDSKGGSAPKSAGASLRRHNEAALVQEIRDLLTSWSDELSRCSRIFLRAPGHNQATFLAGKNPPLSKSDPRLSAISIDTRRPTFHELQRLHAVLAAVHIHEKFCSCAAENFTTDVEYPDGVKADEILCQTPNEAVETLSRMSLDSDSSSEVRLIVDRPVMCPGQNTRVLSCEAEETVDSIVLPEAGAKADGDKQVLGDASLPNGTEAAQQPLDEDGESSSLMTEDICNKDTIDEHTYDMLYTACKTENVSTVQQILDDLKAKHASSEALDTDDAGEMPNDTIKVTTAVSRLLCHNESTTLLHVASQCGHVAIVRLLLLHGADPCLKDCKGRLPYVVAGSKETRQEFRRFVADFPDMYDYTRSQHEHAEQERQRQEEQERLEEERKRLDFLALSDREKRAFAAEQRFKAQQEQQNAADDLITSRCWRCACDITAAVPFEYYDYKFCSVACLKEHRQSSSTVQ